MRLLAERRRARQLFCTPCCSTPHTLTSTEIRSHVRTISDAQAGGGNSSCAAAAAAPAGPRPRPKAAKKREGQARGRNAASSKRSGSSLSRSPRRLQLAFGLNSRGTHPIPPPRPARLESSRGGHRPVSARQILPIQGAHTHTQRTTQHTHSKNGQDSMPHRSFPAGSAALGAPLSPQRPRPPHLTPAPCAPPRPPGVVLRQPPPPSAVAVLRRAGRPRARRVQEREHHVPPTL